MVQAHVSAGRRAEFRVRHAYLRLGVHGGVDDVAFWAIAPGHTRVASGARHHNTVVDERDDRRVIITAGEIERNIITTAMKMDDYRALLGNRPIKITSWYRPAHINSRVGGSQYSRHQYGDAVDWFSYYFTPRQAAKILKADHTDGGYKDYRRFTHTDWRGWKARW